MIIKSKKMIYGGKQYTELDWILNTAERTVTHVDPSTLETTVTDFHTDYVKDHLRYVTAKHPERLEKLVDEGRIIDYLDELETRAIEAVDRQVEIWKKSDKEYLSSMLVSYLDNEYIAKLTVRSIEFDVLHGDEYGED